MTSEKTSLSNSEVINHLVQTNNPLYNLSKIAEEAAELNAALLKRLNKGPQSSGGSDEDIIEEIGDLAIRMEIAKGIFGERAVNDRIQFKLDKYKSYIINNEYIGRI